MYTRQSTVSLALDTVNQGLDFIANRAEYSAELLKDKARSDLFYARAELEKDTQDFLRDLSQRNNFMDFSKMADDFLEEHKSKLNKNAPNNYTARLYNEMLAGYRNELLDNVENQKLRMQIDETNAKDMATLALNAETYSGQTRIDADFRVIASEFASRRINDTEQLNRIINSATEAIYEDKYNTGMGQIGSYISGGKTFDDFKKDFNLSIANKEYKVKMLNPKYYGNEQALQEDIENGTEPSSDISKSIDNKEINKKALKALETEYKKQEEEFHSRNFNSALQRLQGKLNQTTDKEIRERYKAEEYNLFKSTVKLNDKFYSEAQKYQLMHLYEPDGIPLSPEEKKAKKGYTSSEFNSDWKTVSEGVIAAVQNGTGSREYGISNGYEAGTYLKDFYFSYGKQAGINPDELQLGWIAENASFMDKLAKAYKNNGSIANEIETFSKFVKGLKPENYSTNGLIAEANERLLDALMSIDVSRPESVAALEKQLEKEISGIAVTKYSLLKTGKDGDSLFLAQHLNKDGTIKNIKNYIHDMFIGLDNGGSKVVYTDRRDQISMNPNAQKSVNIGDHAVIGWMKSIWPEMKEEDIFPEWESDNNHDLTGRRVYIMNKIPYTFQVTEKLGKDSIEFINAKTGDVIANYDDATKFIKEQNKQKTKDEVKAADEEAKRLESEVNQATLKHFDEEQTRITDMRTKAASMKASDFPSDFYPEGWDQMGITERLAFIESYEEYQKNKKKDK